MEVVQNENIVYFDVDETLITSTIEDGQDHKYRRKIDSVCEANVEQLIYHKRRGFHVTVWSANGYQWALDVVLALGLQTYVDVVKTKPRSYFDDKDANEWMQRAYCD